MIIRSIANRLFASLSQQLVRCYGYYWLRSSSHLTRQAFGACCKDCGGTISCRRGEPESKMGFSTAGFAMGLSSGSFAFGN